VPRGYILAPEALDDIAEIRTYYEEEAGTRVARYVLAEINRAFRFLAATPGAGHSRSDLTDEPMKFWSVFSYLIVYDPAMRPIGIARVLHSSRDLAALFVDRPPRI
jgi:plasmid stabilization system protein ParE